MLLVQSTYCFHIRKVIAVSPKNVQSSIGQSKQSYSGARLRMQIGQAHNFERLSEGGRIHGLKAFVLRPECGNKS